jgi:hypothetical protein
MTICCSVFTIYGQNIKKHWHLFQHYYQLY